MKLTNLIAEEQFDINVSLMCRIKWLEWCVYSLFVVVAGFLTKLSILYLVAMVSLTVGFAWSLLIKKKNEKNLQMYAYQEKQRARQQQMRQRQQTRQPQQQQYDGYENNPQDQYQEEQYYGDGVPPEPADGMYGRMRRY